MTASGFASVSVNAGPLTPTHLPTRPDIGKGFNMGDYLTIHIRPEVARQWIATLEPIAEQDNA